MNQRDMTRYNELQNFLNLTAKTGVVNIREVVTEMAKLINLDITKAINPVVTS